MYLPEDFPYKHERGRKYGVQSGNTLRMNPYDQEPDKLVVGADAHCYFGGLSLDKNKLWEKVQAEQDRQSEWQKIQKTFGLNVDPDDYNPHTRIVEEFTWPGRYRRIVVVNGKKTNGEPAAPTVPRKSGVVKSSYKTVSRAAQKREKQQAQQQHLDSYGAKEDEHVIQIERNEQNSKVVHEKQYQGQQKWWIVDAKKRRQQRKQEIKQLLC